MNRDFESAAWAQNHRQLSEAVARLIEKTAHGFRRLNAIEYDAPWERARH